MRSMVKAPTGLVARVSGKIPNWFIFQAPRHIGLVSGLGYVAANAMSQLLRGGDTRRTGKLSTHHQVGRQPPLHSALHRAMWPCSGAGLTYPQIFKRFHFVSLSGSKWPLPFLGRIRSPCTFGRAFAGGSPWLRLVPLFARMLKRAGRGATHVLTGSKTPRGLSLTASLQFYKACIGASNQRDPSWKFHPIGGVPRHCCNQGTSPRPSNMNASKQVPTPCRREFKIATPCLAFTQIPPSNAPRSLAEHFSEKSSLRGGPS